MTFDQPEYNQRNRQRYREERLASLSPVGERQGWLCPDCGEPIPRDLSETHKDHIIPRARGGPADEEWNWQLLHKACNEKKREHMTERATALAAEHGITLLPPVVRPGRGPSVSPYGTKTETSPAWLPRYG